MARPCSVCAHAARESIDLAIVAGKQPLRAIATERGLTIASVMRHKERHVTKQVRAEVGLALERAHTGTLARSIVSDLLALRDKASALGSKAEATGDFRTALAAVRELTRLVELQERLALEARAGQASDVANHPAWHALRGAIMGALEGDPIVRARVMSAIAGVLGGRVESDPPHETRVSSRGQE